MSLSSVTNHRINGWTGKMQCFCFGWHNFILSRSLKHETQSLQNSNSFNCCKLSSTLTEISTSLGWVQRFSFTCFAYISLWRHDPDQHGSLDLTYEGRYIIEKTVWSGRKELWSRVCSADEKLVCKLGRKRAAGMGIK